MASVHLSISKHSQLSPLSTGGEVIPFLLFSSSVPFLFPSLSFLPSLLSRLIYLVPTSPFILHSLIFQFFSSRSLWWIIFTFSPLFPSLSPPSSFTLNGTAHSATKQSCLEHHTLPNQAGPEFSSLQTHSATSGYGEVLEWSGGGGASPERKPEEDKYSKSNDAY